jgi:hypothetical protein
MSVPEVGVDGFWKFGRCYITYFSGLPEICDLLTVLDELDTCGTNHGWGRSCRCYRVHAFIGFVRSKKNDDDDDDEHACAIN